MRKKFTVVRKKFTAVRKKFTGDKLSKNGKTVFHFLLSLSPVNFFVTAVNFFSPR